MKSPAGSIKMAQQEDRKAGTVQSGFGGERGGDVQMGGNKGSQTVH